MEKTSIASDGTKIIYSDAHQALDAYTTALYYLDAAAETAAAARNDESEARERLRTAQHALLDALQAHYGHLPESLADHGSVLTFETDDDGVVTIRRIKPAASICDLYRCERPVEPTPLYREPETA